jgi:hypothetical protein
MNHMRTSIPRLLLTIATSSAMHAEPLGYELVIPDGESASYSVELDVRAAGPISIRVDGERGRTIALRLDPPTGMPVRRSGPVPLSLVASADPTTNGSGPWHLVLHAPPGIGSVSLHVSIDLPELVRPTPPPPTLPAVPSATPRPSAPWDAQRRLGAPSEHRPFLLAAEEFASARTAEGDAPVDACRWQADLVAYLEKRAAGLAAGRLPPEPTRDVLTRIARAVEAVSELRSSDDPLVTGPEPQEPQRRLAWSRARAERLAPLEAELDDLLAIVQRERTSDLASASWPVRLVTCLTACERYFGSRSADAELAETQWPRIVDAARALRELALVEPSATARARP